MLFKIESGWVRRLRLRLAALLAPAGVEVRDTETTVCACRQDLLEAVFYTQLVTDQRGWLLAPVDDALDELNLAGLINFKDGRPFLSDQGERELDRLWGPDKVPPWYTTGILSCDDHGYYDAHPGDQIRCPWCPDSKVKKERRQWWRGIDRHPV